MSKHIIRQRGHVTLRDRRRLLGTRNKVIWFTGLSGSGKSTLATALEKELYDREIPCYVLDGDNIRHGLSEGLGFSEEDKKENLRRVSEVARLLYDAGLYVLVSLISPYRRGRAFARKLIGKDFLEVFVDCPLTECERRDVKGFYYKARHGGIRQFIGVHEVYEKPLRPDIHLRTDREKLPACVATILSHLNLDCTDRN